MSTQGKVGTKDRPKVRSRSRKTGQKEGFGKEARLLTKTDFRFRPFSKRPGKFFLFVYRTNGLGRLGISISKKVLRRATARNRVRRLIREFYRKHRHEFPKVDVHVIGLAPLTESWSGLSGEQIEKEFNWLRPKN